MTIQSFTGPYHQNDTCPVFLTPLEPDSTVITPCGHLFSHDGLKQWLVRQDRCPLCRKKLDPLSIGLTKAELHYTLGQQPLLLGQQPLLLGQQPLLLEWAESISFRSFMRSFASGAFGSAIGSAVMYRFLFDPQGSLINYVLGSAATVGAMIGPTLVFSEGIVRMNDRDIGDTDMETVIYCIRNAF